jgi:hypothetical protein
MGKIVGTCPTVDVFICSVPVKCLVDTGSQVSTITVSFYIEHFSHLHTLQDCRTYVRLKASNGLDIPVCGLMIVPVVFQDLVCDNVHILVVKDPANPEMKKRKYFVPGLIGCNMLELLKKAVESTDLVQPHLFQEMIQMYVERIGVDNNVDPGVKLEKSFVKSIGRNVRIPGNTSLILTGSTTYVAETCQVLVETLENPNLPDLVVYPTFTTLHDGCVSFQVANTSDKDIVLKRPMRIASVSLAAEVEREIDIQPSQDGTQLTVSYTNECRVQTSDFDNLPFRTNIGDVPMMDSERKQLVTLFTRFQSVFSQTKNDVGHTDLVQHTINTSDNVPVKQPDRAVPPNLVPDVKKILQNWLKSGVIRESESPFASQMVLVRKKSGDIRICVDFRSLNRKTIKDAFPLPRVEDCINALNGAKYFCSLDLTQGYLQVEVHPDHKHKTAFRALGDLYEFNRLPFGLCNSPSTFSRLMRKCFGDKFADGIIMYLDDLLIYGSCISEVIGRLDIVFSRLQRYNLKLNPEKCHFFKDKVTFLGHTVSAHGIEADDSKIQAVKDFPRPTSEKNVRQCLGLASYLRRFVKDFASIAAPLHNVLTGTKRKSRVSSVDDRPFEQKWSPECEASFQQLKTVLSCSPVLAYPNYALPFILEVDASISGYGAVLLQKQNDRKVVIAYASRKLRKQEQQIKSYSSMKLEFLALHWAITKKFRDILYGSEFVVLTDNNPLSRILSTKQTAADMGKLADLSDYNFQIQYKSGRNNQAADALSRNPVNEELVSSNDLIEYISVSGDCTFIPDHLIATACERATEEADIVFQESSLLFSTYSQSDLEKLQIADKSLSKIRNYLADGTMPTSRDVDGRILKRWSQLVLVNGVLYRKFVTNGSECMQFVLPESMKPLVLKHMHDFAGHQGIERTSQLIRERFYWPTLHKDVEIYCRNCRRCVVAKEPVPKVKVKMAHVISNYPLDVVAMDFTVLERSSSGYENVLVLTDIFTKFVLTIPTRDQTARTVAEVLIRDFFNRYGIPRRLHSDRGRSFENKITRTLFIV